MKFDLVTIESGFLRGSCIQPVFHDVIKREPMLYSADREFAMSNGGPLTREFIRRLQWPERDELVIDSRVHMLMPGYYPCIPGWHLDDVTRTTRADGQPDHKHPWNPEHCIAVVDAMDRPTLSMPEFLIGTHTLPEPPDGSGVRTYQLWDGLLGEMAGSAEVADSGCLYYINARTLHRGMPAKRKGWRFFIRATRNRGKKDPSEVRTQVNVYLPTLNMGW